MIVRKTKPEEYRRVNELFAICFEQPYQNCPIDPERDDAIHWAAYDDGGHMMSTFTISDFPVRFDGCVCRMGGVGGVATLPEYRRRGGIRACFEAALPELYGAGYDFSCLYPFSTAYYRKFGYEACVQKYGWSVELFQLAPSKPVGSFRLAEADRPMAEAIRSVDQVWERDFNMMVQHSGEVSQWAVRPDPAVKQEFTYVWYDEENNPKAYTTFRAVQEADGRNLVCSRFCFADREGFAGLLQLFKSLSADHRYVKFQTPALPALQYLLPEWSLGAVRWELLASSGMVRAVNVRSVLEKARYRGSGQVTLEIQDGQIPENNGCFAVTFAEDRAVSVEKGTREADAVLTVSAFSALIAGVCDFQGARHTFSGLTVHRENPALGRVFFRKPLMIVDYF
ncbi:MAG: enhanced intracellular survival protein Eis [Faecousia sp.]